MTKEIIKKCNSYDKQVGCYHTFDGKCNKENCQVYNLLQENENLKEEIKQLTEWKRKSVTCQECYDEGVATADIKINRYKQALEEIREKWNEFKELSPLEISFKQKQVYELDKAINNEVLK